VCIHYRGNVSTEPLPSNNREIFTEPLPSNDKNIVARMWRLYETWYWIDNWIYWITHSYTLTTESLTITTDSHNCCESLLLLSLFRAQDLLQTKLAPTGHQLTLLDSSPQLTVN
jgi:hypothetical protein